MSYYLNKNKRLAIAQIPKAGNTSFHKWLGPSFPNTQNKLVAECSDERVAFIRHPVVRLHSCYSFIRRVMENRGWAHSSGAPSDSWENFVDFILTHKDVHWQPQSEVLGGIQTVCHRFENLLNHFEKYAPGPMPHLNASSRRPVTVYREDELLRAYAADFDLWESAD